MRQRFLITGGAGFIGSAVARQIISSTESEVLVVDKLTYAGSTASLAPAAGDTRFSFLAVDICNSAAMKNALASFAPDVVMHLAAESHVDRSIDGPRTFLDTNVNGTFVLLQEALSYWNTLSRNARTRFRFHHVSTDEVFGALGSHGAFTEEAPYRPNSPYAATKAASDHLVRAWCHTYGLPTIISNCSNNFGPYQFPEKLIPLTILNALEGRAISVYGDGRHVRDWLFVYDHVKALLLIAAHGRVGETYNIGGHGERTNLAIVEAICDLVDTFAPAQNLPTRRDLIKFVKDRPGHDRRYAINANKIARELKWRPDESVESGLARTVRWYINNRDWWETARAETYTGTRLGVTA